MFRFVQVHVLVYKNVRKTQRLHSCSQLRLSCFIIATVLMCSHGVSSCHLCICILYMLDLLSKSFLIIVCNLHYLSARKFERAASIVSEMLYL